MAAQRKHPPKGAAELIRDLAASGYGNIGIAAKFKVSKDTLKRWLEENSLLQDAFELGRETERQALHALIVQAAVAGRGPAVNAFFLLKARHGYIEADKLSQRVNVDVALNNVLVVKDYGTDAQWEARVAAQQRSLIVDAAAVLPIAAPAELPLPAHVSAAPTSPGLAPSSHRFGPPSWPTES